MIKVEPHSVLSARGLQNLVASLAPIDLNRDHDRYDVGYEAAKRDIARKLAKEIGYVPPSNPAGALRRALRHGD